MCRSNSVFIWNQSSLKCVHKSFLKEGEKSVKRAKKGKEQRKGSFEKQEKGSSYVTLFFFFSFPHLVPWQFFEKCHAVSRLLLWYTQSQHLRMEADTAWFYLRLHTCSTWTVFFFFYSVTVWLADATYNATYSTKQAPSCVHFISASTCSPSHRPFCRSFANTNALFSLF